MNERKPILTERIAAAITKLKVIFPFDGYLRNFSDHIEVAKILSRYLPEGAKILDIGSGPCDKTAILAFLEFQCTACDNLSDFWHRWSSNRKLIVDFASRAGIRFDLLDGSELPYPDESFDCVMILAVIEHLHETPRLIMNSAVSKLRPGGLLLVIMPNSVNLRKRMDVIRGESNYPDLEQVFWSSVPWRGHVREYTLSETKRLFKLMRLEIVRSFTFHSMLETRIKNSIIKFVYKIVTSLVPNARDSILVLGKKPPRWEPVQADEEKFLRYFPQCHELDVKRKGERHSV